MGNYRWLWVGWGLGGNQIEEAVITEVGTAGPPGLAVGQQMEVKPAVSSLDLASTGEAQGCRGFWTPS